MKIICDVCGVCSANMYTVYDELGRAVIIDPVDAQLAEMHINMYSLSVKAILITHAHFDHISDLQEIRKISANPPTVIHYLDNDALSDPEKNLSRLFGQAKRFDKCEYIVNDGDVIELDGFSIRVFHTPGHTVGSSVYQIGNVLFTGDTLFCGNVGRCDLYGGSASSLASSLKRLASFDEGLKVYPGHGNFTTIGFEKENNYFMTL